MKGQLSKNGRRGSSLLIVLGILSVLMLLAVAFATFERTERGSTTNLKNAFVARNSLATAVGRVIEAIDVSFDDPSGDDPVCPWPHPWLASAGDPMLDYLQSATRDSGDNANVLTAEISKYLSPAQLALVKAAKCDWAPINSSISASAAGGSDRAYGGTYGDSGRPINDDLIGRYAFVVLETTGLMDLNMTGTGSYTDSATDAARVARKTDEDCRPSTFLIPQDDALVWSGKDDKPQTFPVEPFLYIPKNLPADRAFSSLADAIGQCAAGTFVTGKSDVAGVVNRSKGPSDAKWRHYPADLFAGFAPSLSGLDPEGLPKVRLPSWKEFNHDWSKAEIREFAGQTMEAMSKIFAWSREEAERGTADKKERDEMTIFEGVEGKEYRLPRPLLAAVALLDGMDCDGWPGECESPNVSYFDVAALKNPSEVEITDYSGVPRSISEGGLASVPGPEPNYLNFPCTESSVLLDLVVAHVSDITYEDEGDERVYTVEVSVKAVGHCQNKTAESSEHTATMKLEWEIGSDDPDWLDRLSLTAQVDDDPHGNAINWEDADGFGNDEDGTVVVEDASGRAKLSGSGSVSVNYNRRLEVEDIQSFVVRCQRKPVQGADGKPILDDNGWPVDYDGYYPLTAAQYNEEDGDAFLPIRVKVTIWDKKSTTDADGVHNAHAERKMQEVPAPALGDDYRIPLNVGIYHGDKSKFGGPRFDPEDPDPDTPAEECFSWGWAFCLAPAFAFDTVSLFDPGGTKNGFWIGDQSAYSAPGKHGSAIVPDLCDLLWENGNDNIMDYSDAGSKLNGEIFNELQKSWLLNAEALDLDPDPVSGWLDTTGRHVPDFRHAASHGGTEFGRGPGSHNSELYSWIPAKGYARPADLGTVMCGPLETLSLFKTYQTGIGGSDFHRVLDYFDPPEGEGRYPASTNGTDWAALSGRVGKNSDGTSRSRLLFSGVRNGRVNLNAPYLVKCTKPATNETVNGTSNPPIRGDASDRLNPYPIATVLNGAPLFHKATTDEEKEKRWNQPEQIATLREEDALDIACGLCKMLEKLSLDTPANVAEAHRFTDDEGDVVRRRVVRNLSFLGLGRDSANDVLETWVQAGGWRKEAGNDVKHLPENDYEREGLIRGVADGFTTRGQTFLAIIRADAYTPKFGQNSSAKDGTTLATTHAIVELFRDPVPARTPEGTMPSDGSGRPVSFHNWYIRSFRVF